MRAIASLSFRPVAVSWGVALLSLIVPPATARSFGQAVPKVSVDALSPPLPSPLVDRDVAPSSHYAESYGTPQTVTPPPAPPNSAATPPVAPVYGAAPQVPIVVSPSPTPVMIQPGPTTVLIGQTPPPNIIYAGSPPAQSSPNLMMLPAPQSPPVASAPSPQGTTTSASVQYVMAQPVAPPQQQQQVSAVFLRHPGPICSALGAVGRSLAKLGQPTIETSPSPLYTQVVHVAAPQQTQTVAPPQAPAPPPVAAEPPRPSPQSEPGHRWRLFRR